MIPRLRFTALAATLGCAAVLASCGRAGENRQTPAFDAIAQSETIRVVGTEPFWNAVIKEGELTYSTPEELDGKSTFVTRFAGNSGLAFHGTLAAQPLDLVITRGNCSDGMSDRTYPFTATLQLGEEQREGCAWSDNHPFTGDPAP